MATNIQMSQQDYEALIAFARRGVLTEQEGRTLSSFLQTLEKSNNITRDALWVQWQEVGKQVSVQYSFPESWPPNLRAYIELVGRPIAKADVTALLAKKAIRPMSVMVTKDPAGVVGWTTLEAFFV